MLVVSKIPQTVLGLDVLLTHSRLPVNQHVFVAFVPQQAATEPCTHPLSLGLTASSRSNTHQPHKPRGWTGETPLDGTTTQTDFSYCKHCVNFLFWIHCVNFLFWIQLTSLFSFCLQYAQCSIKSLFVMATYAYVC